MSIPRTSNKEELLGKSCAAFNTFVDQEKNLFGMKGPRKLKVVVPVVDENGEVVASNSECGRSLADSLKAKDGMSVGLVNNPPKWSEGFVIRS